MQILPIIVTNVGATNEQTNENKTNKQKNSHSVVMPGFAFLLEQINSFQGDSFHWVSVNQSLG